MAHGWLTIWQGRWVTELSRSTPTLLLVEDLQWLDPASAAVLGLVARGLPGTGAGLLSPSSVGVMI
jgi:predicted ATPase